MKTFLIYIAFAYLALAIQGLFFHGVKPDLALILVCFFSVRHGQSSGITYGALIGLLIDVSSGFILGPHILSKAVAAYLSRTIRDHIFQWNIYISAVVIAALSATDILVVYISYETFAKISFMNRPWGISFAGIAYTTVTALLAYPMFHRGQEERLWINE